MIDVLPLFQNEPNAEDYNPGDVIFSAGDSSKEMFVVREGEVEIRVRGNVVETVSPGGLFGEMVLIDESTRSADAVAKTACTLVKVDKRRFEYLIQQTPFFAIQIMELLVTRIRNTNNLLIEKSR